MDQVIVFVKTNRSDIDYVILKTFRLLPVHCILLSVLELAHLNVTTKCIYCNVSSRSCSIVLLYHCPTAARSPVCILRLSFYSSSDCHTHAVPPVHTHTLLHMGLG